MSHKAIGLLPVLGYRLTSRREEGEVQYNVAQEWRATLMMTNRYCQAVGCYDVIESHKRYSPMDRLIH